jgi:hypothetical protein
MVNVNTFIKKYYPEFQAELVAEKQAKKRGVSIAEIKQEWHKSMENGKFIHAQIASGRSCTPEATHALNYLQSRGFKDVMQERVCGNAIWNLAGTPDVIGITDQGLVILDWKTGSYSLGNHFEKCYVPFQKDQNTKHFQTSLQMSCYALMIEAEMGKPVVEMTAVHVTPEGKDAYPAYDLRKEIMVELAKCSL